MNTQAKTDRFLRKYVLMLLSDDEVASVSSIESTARLLDGEEYLDLKNLEQGVRSAFGTDRAEMGNVLPRRAVRGDTWHTILERLALFHAARARTGD
jgi:hypothetical protein